MRLTYEPPGTLDVTNAYRGKSTKGFSRKYNISTSMSEGGNPPFGGTLTL